MGEWIDGLSAQSQVMLLVFSYGLGLGLESKGLVREEREDLHG